jgi:hypothetical protein
MIQLGQSSVEFVISCVEYDPFITLYKYSKNQHYLLYREAYNEMGDEIQLETSSQY